MPTTTTPYCLNCEWRLARTPQGYCEPCQARYEAHVRRDMELLATGQRERYVWESREDEAAIRQAWEAGEDHRWWISRYARS